MTHARTLARTSGAHPGLFAAAALVSLNHSPHAAASTAQEVGCTSSPRALHLTTAKITSGAKKAHDHGAMKIKLGSDVDAKVGKPMAQKDSGTFGTLRGATMHKTGTTSMANSDGHGAAKKFDAGTATLRIGHHVTVQRKRMGGNSIRRATADGGWTRRLA